MMAHPVDTHPSLHWGAPVVCVQGLGWPTESHYHFQNEAVGVYCTLRMEGVGFTLSRAQCIL